METWKDAGNTKVCSFLPGKSGAKRVFEFYFPYLLVSVLNTTAFSKLYTNMFSVKYLNLTRFFLVAVQLKVNSLFIQNRYKVQTYYFYLFTPCVYVHVLYRFHKKVASPCFDDVQILAHDSLYNWNCRYVGT